MSNKPELHETAGLLFGAIARLMRRDFDRRMQHLGLTQSQWRTLLYLSLNEGTTQAALAESLEIQPITLARLLDRMESWVERRPCPTDRRAFQLYLTPTSEPLMRQIRELGIPTRDVALAGLSEEQRELLTQMLATVKDNLQRADTGAADSASNQPSNSVVV
jgi:MarR family transcriptional regulator for hemolysin